MTRRRLLTPRPRAHVVCRGGDAAHRLQRKLVERHGRGAVAAFGDEVERGGPVEEIRSGDVVTVGPDEKHWHGAAPTTAMTHMAIQEALDGKAVEWLEKVTDEQYRAR
jgi:hypothetical protein